MATPALGRKLQWKVLPLSSEACKRNVTGSEGKKKRGERTGGGERSGTIINAIKMHLHAAQRSLTELTSTVDSRVVISSNY
jgi:hypothetical protein